MSIWIYFWFVLMDIGKAFSMAVVPVCPPINKSVRVLISSHLELHKVLSNLFLLANYIDENQEALLFFIYFLVRVKLSNFSYQ